MKVTPLEIRQKTFEKGFRGYEKEEVDAYLMALSGEWEKLQIEARDQKVKIELLEKDVQKMREVESTLYKTLKTAETTGSTMVEQANKTAELMLKEAQMNSDAVLNEAKYQAKNYIEEAEAKSKNLAEEAKDFLKIAQREVKDIDNLKDNLLMELRNLANDTLERIGKINNRTTKNPSIDPTPLFAQEPVVGAVITHDDESMTVELKKLKHNGSFFDQI